MPIGLFSHPNLVELTLHLTDVSLMSLLTSSDGYGYDTNFSIFGWNNTYTSQNIDSILEQLSNKTYYWEWTFEYNLNIQFYLSGSQICFQLDEVPGYENYKKLFPESVQLFLNETYSCIEPCESERYRLLCLGTEWQIGVCNSKCNIEDCGFDGGDCNQLCNVSFATTQLQLQQETIVQLLLLVTYMICLIMVFVIWNVILVIVVMILVNVCH